MPACIDSWLRARDIGWAEDCGIGKNGDACRHGEVGVVRPLVTSLVIIPSMTPIGDCIWKQVPDPVVVGTARAVSIPSLFPHQPWFRLSFDTGERSSVGVRSAPFMFMGSSNTIAEGGGWADTGDGIPLNDACVPNIYCCCCSIVVGTWTDATGGGNPFKLGVNSVV